MQFLPRIGEYYTFYSWFLLGLGLVFQLPVVIFVLARIGLVTPAFLLRKFKYAVLAAFVVSAVITPSARRRDADAAGAADPRPLPAWESRWPGCSDGRDGRGRRASARRLEAERLPSATFSRLAWPAFISTT